MKKYIIFLVILLFCVGLVPIKYNNKNINTNKIEILNKKQTSTYIDWKLSNDGCYGCASFYWKVTRSYDYNTNRYLFYIYFYSNSYYENTIWASTYLTGVYINVDNFYINKQPIWLLFKDVYTNQLTSFYSYNANPTIKITWTGMSIY